MIYFVTPDGEVRNFIEDYPEKIVVGPVLSLVGDRPIFSASMTLEEIQSYKKNHFAESTSRGRYVRLVLSAS